MASKYRPSGRSDYRMQRLSEGLEGAQSGAALGSALGPGGALVGGLIGGAAGALRGGPSEAQRARDAELNELLRRKQIDALGLTGEERRAMERQIKDPLRTQQREFANRMAGMDMGAGATAAQAIALQEQQARQQMDADAEIALADLETKQSEEDLMRELQQEKQDELNREKKEAMKAAAGLATTATKAAEELAEGSILAEWQDILKNGSAGRLTDQIKKNIEFIRGSLKSEASPENVAKGVSLYEKTVGLPADALEKAENAALEKESNWAPSLERAEESRVALAEADAQADRDLLAQGRADIRAGLDAMGTPIAGPPGIMGVDTSGLGQPIPQIPSPPMLKADAYPPQWGPILGGRSQTLVEGGDQFNIAPFPAALGASTIPRPGIMGVDTSGLGQTLPVVPSRANAADLAFLGVDPTIPMGNDPRFADSADPGIGRLAHLDSVTGGPVGDPYSPTARRDFAYYPSEWFSYPEYREDILRADLRRLGKKR